MADHAPPGIQPVREVVLEPRDYEVVGPKEVFGHAPGETVTLVLSDGQAAALVESGHLAPVVAPVTEDLEQLAPVEDVTGPVEPAVEEES